MSIYELIFLSNLAIVLLFNIVIMARFSKHSAKLTRDIKDIKKDFKKLKKRVDK